MILSNTRSSVKLKKKTKKTKLNTNSLENIRKVNTITEEH